MNGGKGTIEFLFSSNLYIYTYSLFEIYVDVNSLSINSDYEQSMNRALYNRLSLCIHSSHTYLVCETFRL